RRQSNEDQATSSYIEAQKIFAHIGKADREVDAFSALRDLYHRSISVTAEVPYTKAQKIFARKVFEGDQANALFGIGVVYRHQSKYDQATLSYTQAHEIYSRISHKNGQANALYGLGEVYRRQYRKEQALSSYKQAREIYARLGKDSGVRQVTWALLSLRSVP
ncbi:hypothetical protein FS837_006782, partial [Tulasnella sp. UAMH 9824]